MKLSLLIFSLSTLSVVYGYIPFSYKDCGKSDRTVLFEKIWISESPIPVQSRQPLEASFRFITKQVLDNNVKVKIRFVRYIRIFGTIEIPAPCIATFGSCNHRFCDLYDSAVNTFCPILEKAGIECKCPFPAADYAAENVKIKLPTVSLPLVIAAIGSGNYGLTAKIEDSSGKEIGCLEMKLPVDMSPKL